MCHEKRSSPGGAGAHGKGKDARLQGGSALPAAGRRYKDDGNSKCKCAHRKGGRYTRNGETIGRGKGKDARLQGKSAATKATAKPKATRRHVPTLRCTWAELPHHVNSFQTDHVGSLFRRTDERLLWPPAGRRPSRRAPNAREPRMALGSLIARRKRRTFRLGWYTSGRARRIGRIDRVLERLDFAELLRLFQSLGSILCDHCDTSSLGIDSCGSLPNVSGRLCSVSAPWLCAPAT